MTELGPNRSSKETERSFAQLTTNPLFKDAVKGKPLSPSIIEIGNQSAEKGRNAGIVILICAASIIGLTTLSGQITFRTPYIVTGYALAGLGAAAAFFYWQNWMVGYFLILSSLPITATIIFAIGFNDTAGFFINGLAMSLLVASLLIEKNHFFVFVLSLIHI